MTQSVSVDEKSRQIHFEIGGSFDLDAMKSFLSGLDAKAATMVTQGGPFSALGVMTNLDVLSEEVADYIRKHLMNAKEVGLQKVAIIDPPMLVKLAYRRLSEGVYVEFFNKKEDGLRWLRG